MNKPKSQPTNQSNKMAHNNTYLKERVQWQPNNQSSNGAHSPLANYTLPGVINYLTSEFTNLERFKIMTNLEISEMKYKIIQLQGELNSSKYINEKLKTRVEELEKENKRLKGITGETEHASFPNDETTNNDFTIPEVDLSVIAKSRNQLEKSIDEVLFLLKIPSAHSMNSLKLPEPGENDKNGINELIPNNPRGDFYFNNNTEQDKSRGMGKKSFFSQYLNNDKPETHTEQRESDVESGQKQDNNSSRSKNLEEIISITDEDHDDFEPSLISRNGYESDADTILFDIEEEVLTNAPESVMEFKDSNYSDSKIFTSDNFIVHLSFNSNTNSEWVRFNVWSSSENRDIIISETNIPFENNPSKIIDLYPISCTDKCANFILTYETGSVEYLVFDNEKFSNKLIITSLLESKNFVKSTDMIEFLHKSRNISNEFGLIINIGGQKPVIKVYHLLISSFGNQVEANVIGSYDKNIFKDCVNTDGFDTANWFKSEDNFQVDSSEQPKDEIGLFPYWVITKSNKQLAALNIVSNSIHNLIEYDGDLSKGLSSQNFKLLVEPSDSNDFIVKLFDLENEKVISESTLKSSNLLLVEMDQKVSIFELQNEILAIYDSTFQNLKKLKIDEAELLENTSDKLIISTKSKTSKVYELKALLSR